MKTLRAMPILRVRDVRAAAGFYERLGFACHGYWGDPPGFAILQRGEVTLGVFLRGEEANPDAGAVTPDDHWATYLYVDDIDALHGEFTALGGLTLTEVCDQPYGCRDFDVIDPDGHRVAFGQDVTDNANGPGLSAERGRG